MALTYQDDLSIPAKLVDELHALESALKRLNVLEDGEIQDILESMREDIKFFV